MQLPPGGPPEVVDTRLLCLLGEAAWRSILGYRTLLAAVWDDMTACEHEAHHEARCADALASATHLDESGAGSADHWRHLTLGDRPEGLAAIELGLHCGHRAVTAAVAAARLTDAEGIYWALPVAARPAT
ncbi:MAG: hypothetical protein ACRDY7_16160 [Acidimicrobiia bacterium]